MGCVRGGSKGGRRVPLRVAGCERREAGDGRGIYREIVRPERIVATEKFDELWYRGDAVDATVLVEKNGKTTITTTVLYESQEVRDGVLESPMEGGVSKSYDKLEELLAARMTGQDK